ncbi:MAG TPA: hypothetical protein VIY73_15265 [Polyangiaceae bacterium]
MRLAPLVLCAIAASTVIAPRGAAADDKAQCLTASDQGQSLRDDGKYHKAREAFAACARETCPSIVRRDCMKWLADLEQSWPSVVVGAKDDKGADLVDVKVLVDGALLVSRLDGNPAPVDPGEHVFRFETAGYPPVEQRVVVRAGEKSRLLAVQFATSTSAPQGEAAAPAAGGPPDEHRTPRGPRTSAWVFGGLAVAAFGTEAFFGLSGLSDRSHLKSQPCAQTASCAQSSVDSIRTKFTVADIALGVGLVSAAISAYLFIVAPGEPAAAPAPASALDVRPVPGGATMDVTGRF